MRKLLVTGAFSRTVQAAQARMPGAEALCVFLARRGGFAMDDGCAGGRPALSGDAELAVLRLFVALSLPDRTRRALAALGEVCRKEFPCTEIGRFHASDSTTMHLTLAFLGNVEKRRCPELMKSLSQVGGRPFSLCFARSGFFDQRQQCTLWVGIEENRELLALQRDVAQVAAPFAEKRERDRFLPHCTIGRVRFAKGRAGARRSDMRQGVQTLVRRLDEALCVCPLQPVEVSSFELVQSIPAREGVRHVVLASVLLEKASHLP